MTKAIGWLALALEMCCAAVCAQEPQEPQPAFAPRPPAKLKITPWAEKKTFVHPPLKVMEPYVNISEYPVFAWAFHGRGTPGYNVEYVQQAAMSGFNALIDVALMLEPAEKVEHMMVMVPAFKFSPERLDNDLFNRFANHPRLVGVVLDDNCQSMRYAMPGARYVSEKFPHVVPYVSENPGPGQQIGTPMKVFGTQNYELYRGKKRNVIGYTGTLDVDRILSNRENMTFWPIFAAPMNAGCYRFQVYAALAYGAQGVVCFAYAPGDRWPEWKAPDGWLSGVARKANLYARKVAGRHLWGCRSLGAWHSTGEPIHRGGLYAAPDQVVQRMDPGLLCGLLVPEQDFAGWKNERAPDYAMVVDKRVHYSGCGEPRVAKVRFGPRVSHVEVLLLPEEGRENPLRVIEPGWQVALPLEAGEGRLLILNPKDLPEVLGAEGAKLYLETVAAVSDLTPRMFDGPVDKGVIEKVFGGAQKPLERLEKLASSTPQARDTIARLKERLEEIRAEALTPKPATETAPAPAPAG